jgi:hypothetical protein
MQARVVPIINCGRLNPPTKGVRLDGSFVYPCTVCEIPGGKINVYTTEVDIKRGLFDVKCGETRCRFYGGRRGERLG